MLLPARQIEATAEAIRDVARERVLDTAREIGRLVIDGVFGGELDAWRNRGRKDPSFQQLVTRLDRSEISESTLHRSVGILELEDRLGYPALDRLTATHGFVVLGLPGPVQQELLDRARNEQLSSRELQALAIERRPKKRLGRKPKPAVMKSLDRARKMLEQGGFEEMDALDAIDEERARSLLATAEAARDHFDAITRRLKERLDAG